MPYKLFYIIFHFTWNINIINMVFITITFLPKKKASINFVLFRVLRLWPALQKKHKIFPARRRELPQSVSCLWIVQIQEPKQKRKAQYVNSNLSVSCFCFTFILLQIYIENLHSKRIIFSEWNCKGLQNKKRTTSIRDSPNILDSFLHPIKSRSAYL